MWLTNLLQVQATQFQSFQELLQHSLFTLLGHYLAYKTSEEIMVIVNVDFICDLSFAMSLSKKIYESFDNNPHLGHFLKASNNYS
jgi:hypothetical protein